MRQHLFIPLADEDSENETTIRDFASARMKETPLFGTYDNRKPADVSSSRRKETGSTAPTSAYIYGAVNPRREKNFRATPYPHTQTLQTNPYNLSTTSSPLSSPNRNVVSKSLGIAKTALSTLTGWLRPSVRPEYPIEAAADAYKLPAEDVNKRTQIVHPEPTFVNSELPRGMSEKDSPALSTISVPRPAPKCPDRVQPREIPMQSENGTSRKRHLYEDAPTGHAESVFGAREFVLDNLAQQYSRQFTSSEVASFAKRRRGVLGTRLRWKMQCQAGPTCKWIDYAKPFVLEEPPKQIVSSPRKDSATVNAGGLSERSLEREEPPVPLPIPQPEGKGPELAKQIGSIVTELSDKRELGKQREDDPKLRASQATTCLTKPKPDQFSTKAAQPKPAGQPEPSAGQSTSANIDSAQPPTADGKPAGLRLFKPLAVPSPVSLTVPSKPVPKVSFPPVVETPEDKQPAPITTVPVTSLMAAASAATVPLTTAPVTTAPAPTAQTPWWLRNKDKPNLVQTEEDSSTLLNDEEKTDSALPAKSLEAKPLAPFGGSVAGNLEQKSLFDQPALKFQTDTAKSLFVESQPSIFGPQRSVTEPTQEHKLAQEKSAVPTSPPVPMFGSVDLPRSGLFAPTAEPRTESSSIFGKQPLFPIQKPSKPDAVQAPTAGITQEPSIIFGSSAPEPKAGAGTGQSSLFGTRSFPGGGISAPGQDTAVGTVSGPVKSLFDTKPIFSVPDMTAKPVQMTSLFARDSEPLNSHPEQSGGVFGSLSAGSKGSLFGQGSASLFGAPALSASQVQPQSTSVSSSLFGSGLSTPVQPSTSLFGAPSSSSAVQAPAQAPMFGGSLFSLPQTNMPKAQESQPPSSPFGPHLAGSTTGNLFTQGAFEAPKPRLRIKRTLH